MDETTTPKGSGDGADTAGDASSRFSKARDYVGQKYESASDAVRDRYNTVREKVEDVDFGAITDQVRTYVRSNPGKALLISVGVGFLIGLLLRRDDEE
jgi:ElaB/YqjD/DUF883 family membrane-anchored ribosome-binding protein